MVPDGSIFTLASLDKEFSPNDKYSSSKYKPNPLLFLKTPHRPLNAPTTSHKHSKRLSQDSTRILRALMEEDEQYGESIASKTDLKGQVTGSNPRSAVIESPKHSRARYSVRHPGALSREMVLSPQMKSKLVTFKREDSITKHQHQRPSLKHEVSSSGGVSPNPTEKEGSAPTKKPLWLRSNTIALKKSGSRDSRWSFSKQSNRSSIVKQPSKTLEEKSNTVMGTIRRKSCYCSECGGMSSIEKKHVNITVPTKRDQKNAEENSSSRKLSWFSPSPDKLYLCAVPTTFKKSLVALDSVMTSPRSQIVQNRSMKISIYPHDTTMRTPREREGSEVSNRKTSETIPQTELLVSRINDDDDLNNNESSPYSRKGEQKTTTIIHEEAKGGELFGHKLSFLESKEEKANDQQKDSAKTGTTKLPKIASSRQKTAGAEKRTRTIQTSKLNEMLREVKVTNDNTVENSKSPRGNKTIEKTYRIQNPSKRPITKSINRSAYSSLNGKVKPEKSQTTREHTDYMLSPSSPRDNTVQSSNRKVNDSYSYDPYNLTSLSVKKLGIQNSSKEGIKVNTSKYSSGDSNSNSKNNQKPVNPIKIKLGKIVITPTLSDRGPVTNGCSPFTEKTSVPMEKIYQSAGYELNKLTKKILGQTGAKASKS